MVARSSSAARLPLTGVVVLDLTLARAGPTCVRHLADWGADVIRIEPPESMGEDAVGRRHGPDFQNLHRNKRLDAPIHSPLFGDTRLVSSALNFTGVPRDIRTPAPEAGAHTEEILGWLGYSREETDRLREAGVTQPAKSVA